MARVTPITVATCSSLSDFASRSLRRSLGEGSGWAEAISVGPCVMKDPAGLYRVEKYINAYWATQRPFACYAEKARVVGNMAR